MKYAIRLFLVLAATALSLAGKAQSATSSPDPLLTSKIADKYAKRIFHSSGATGMALVVIDGNQQLFTSYGETFPGNATLPKKDSLIRIASLTKLMTSEVMVKLAEQGVLHLDDPLSNYAPSGFAVPSYGSMPIRLIDLATHTSGLPREMPGGLWSRPVFTWPSRKQRWSWLNSAHLRTPPGVSAGYSNLAFDLLADALANAANEPYTILLKTEVTQELGMKDTTFTPSPEQCNRLMIPAIKASPCNNTLAAIGSGGLYSTPDDIARWMRQFLESDVHMRTKQIDRLQTLIYQRDQLTTVSGLDVPGRADALGMGWVYMAPRDGHPGIIHKTGGGGGFISYMAMVPEHNVGVFVVTTRSHFTHFTSMSNGVNDLLTELVGSQK